MNREEVLEQLRPLTNTQVRQVEHGSRTRVIVTPEMVTLRPGSGGRLVPLSDNGVKAMATFVGMPQSLGRHLSFDTFGRVATELLARKERYNLLIDEGQVRDFAEYQGLRRIEPERVVNIIERVIPQADYYRVSLLENYTAMIEIVGERRQAVARGDMVRAGSMVTFSPIGTVRPLVQSYVMRLVCTNGMTANNILREFRAGGNGDGDGDLWNWFSNSIRDSYQALDAIVMRYRQMTTERIPAGQRAMLLEGLLREAHISGEDADAVRARAIEAPPRNMYDLVNLITWASSHVIREPRRVRQAMLTTANFTGQETHAQVCPVCQRRRA